MSMDQIEKKVVLKAPRERVWRAVSEADSFGRWFGVDFDGPFVAGRKLSGRIVPTTVDAEVAKLQAPHAGTPFAFVVDAIEPMDRFAFRWHPFAIDPAVDYSLEAMTLVEFLLEDAEGGVLLTIRESGFERIPLARRAAAFAANDGGWTHQTRLVAKYLALPA
ncbi:SRPBCC family protein [Solimonas terrae]|uniref:SRPBCC family protein n=1 Tax=Solimonas terrae TaxID=1396819 RepID=UPI0019D58816|nr:SRPBCC family protein [Solimonas terrae]